MEEQLKKRYESLSDRLAKLDEYHKQVNPIIADNTATLVSNQPTQGDPLEGWKAIANLGSQSQYEQTMQSQLNDATSQWRQYQKDQSDEKYRQATLKNEQTRLAIDAAKAGKSITIDPTTGAVTYKDQTPEDIIKNLPTKARTDVSNYLAFLKDTQDLQDLMVKAQADSSLGTLGGVTGPLDQLKGQLIGSAAQKEFRAKLDAYRANIRKGLYGSVLTKQEIAEGNKFLPGNGAFESENNIRIASLFDSKMNALKARLQAEGLDASTVESLSSNLLNSDTTQSSSGPVYLKDPNTGNLYKYDNPNDPEIQQAISSGFIKQ